MTYYFETYGCQMNTAESAALEKRLSRRGWTLALSAKTADMVVINTCSVRQTAENRVFGRLGYYTAMKRQRQFILVLMGCMAERLAEQLQKDYPAIDYVVGNLPDTLKYNKANFDEVAAQAEKAQLIRHCEGGEAVRGNLVLQGEDCFTSSQAGSNRNDGVLLSAQRSSLITSSYVPIMQGCNNFCTYCIVPYLRGREVSRPADEILCEVDTLINGGAKEITLLGQNVNSYHSGDTDFASLLRLISSFVTNHYPLSTNHYPWVRFMSSHPKDLSEDVITAIAECPAVCRHIHLPVQSGSTRILKAMNRQYTREDYLALVRRIREAIPDVSLTTDVMAGFPGETEEDFADTMSLMEEVRYENAFMYYYNVREGTPAAKMADQLPEGVKKARLQKIIDRQLEITKEVMASRIGQTVTALVEGVSRDSKDEMLCRTERDERVVFKGTARAGSFVRVKLAILNGHTFAGEIAVSK